MAELIAKLREEGAIRAELDPVAQQMLRYREQLSTATAAERAEVEALIKVREQEKSMEVLTDYLATNTLDLLKGITRGGDAAAASMKKFANSILDAAMQALILGKGPLADLLGISGNIFQGGGGGKGGGGGLLSGLLGGVAALFGGGGKTKLAAGVGAGGGLKFANGGMVFGAGGGRDDRVPLWGSAGEFMVNARSTAQYRPLLERINAAPGFADGGLIGGGGGLVGAGGGARAMNINVNVTGANGNAEILDMVHQGVAKGIDIYRREAMPGDVIRVSRNPNERGR